MKKYQNLLCVGIVSLFFLSLTLAAWFSPAKTFSDSERRKLAQLPSITLDAIRDGSFMTDFEKYTQDQFPLRDTFRTVKAYTAYKLFHQLDNNGIYLQDGYAAKLEYPLHADSVQHATDRFRYLYDRYLANRDMSIYVSVVPDKSYYLAKENGYPAMEYDALFQMIQNQMEYAQYIDITDTLDITDYYKTDTHWRQEKLMDTARKIADTMGVSLTESYQENKLAHPFYGVYYGQAALPLPAETIYYLTNDTLTDCKVTNYENGSTGGIYAMDKAEGKDPYELFLSGSVSLLTIENANASTDRELILFRDSFGSSIAPLWVEAYKKITLVDIRYLRADFLENFIDFQNQDILFLYSTLVLNNSETLT